MLVEALIAQICIGMQGSQLEACHKVLEAAGLQTRITQQVNAVENGVQQYAQARATYVVHKVGVEKPLGAVLYVVRIVRDKHVEYRLIRNSGIIPEVRAGAGLEGGSLQLHWGF